MGKAVYIIEYNILLQSVMAVVKVKPVKSTYLGETWGVRVSFFLTTQGVGHECAHCQTRQVRIRYYNMWRTSRKYQAAAFMLLARRRVATYPNNNYIFPALNVSTSVPVPDSTVSMYLTSWFFNNLVIELLISIKCQNRNKNGQHHEHHNHRYHVTKVCMMEKRHQPKPPVAKLTS